MCYFISILNLKVLYKTLGERRATHIGIGSNFALHCKSSRKSRTVGDRPRLITGKLKNKQKFLATTLSAKIVQENNRSRREETIDVNLVTSILGNSSEEN